MSMDLLQTL